MTSATASRIAPDARAYQCHHCGEFLFDEQVEVDIPSREELEKIRETRGRYRRGNLALVECFDKYHLDRHGNRCGPVQPLVCYR